VVQKIDGASGVLELKSHGCILLSVSDAPGRNAEGSTDFPADGS
jgi:hypothetical protein